MGKDSAVAALSTNAHLDAIGHDRHRRFVAHADLGRIEWTSTAALIDLPLITVERKAGDLISR